MGLQSQTAGAGFFQQLQLMSVFKRPSLVCLNKELFPMKIQTTDDVRRVYYIYWSLRRSSDTRALEKKISPTDIDIVNRWVSVEKGKGKRPAMEMKHHYANVTMLIGPCTRYVRAM